MNDLKIQKKRSGYTIRRLLKMYGIAPATYYDWFDNNNQVKDIRVKRSKIYTRLLAEEIKTVVDFRSDNPDEGYRKLTWMMVDRNIAYITEITVYRLLKSLNMLFMGKSPDKAESEYKNKPLYVHHHWHTDIAYIKIRGIFYFLIMMLDGYSRFLLNWELMTDMTELSVSLFVNQTRENYPEGRPMLIMDNGIQFVARDFKKLLSEINLEPVHSRPYHPQTNGKIERMNGTVKSEAIKKNNPVSYKEACNILNDYQYKYNYQRLHAGIKYVRPSDIFFGREKEVLKDRKRKIVLARQERILKNKSLEKV